MYRVVLKNTCHWLVQFQYRTALAPHPHESTIYAVRVEEAAVYKRGGDLSRDYASGKVFQIHAFVLRYNSILGALGQRQYLLPRSQHDGLVRGGVDEANDERRCQFEHLAVHPHDTFQAAHLSAQYSALRHFELMTQNCDYICRQ